MTSHTDDYISKLSTQVFYKVLLSIQDSFTWWIISNKLKVHMHDETSYLVESQLQKLH